MILEEETFKKFGYYPKDLKPKSGRRILAKCDECGKIRDVFRYGYCNRCHQCGLKDKKRREYWQEFFTVSLNYLTNGECYLKKDMNK